MDDLIDGLVRLMKSPEDFMRPVNIGNPGEFTVIELGEKVIALAGSRSPIRMLPPLIDDPRQRQISLRRRIVWIGNPRVR